MVLGKYSIGVGDRFARQGKALLAAMVRARGEGIDVTPVWNKSHREHVIIGTAPMSVRAEADRAVADLGWEGAYFVDADHVSMDNVDLFIEASDMFTLDVADMIGPEADEDDVRAFVDRHPKCVGELALEGIEGPLAISQGQMSDAARKFLPAVRHAGAIYRHVETVKGAGNFIAEVSMDETDRAQSPAELLVILAAMADEGVRARTVAPKFTGRFNKGVDYAGDIERFADQFERDVAVVAFAVDQFDLPDDLKLSVHSGSDKFSIYPAMREAIRKFDAGLHLKTAGTTWLEELIGLASAGGEGLAIVKGVYAAALVRFDELCGPYATVIDIDPSRLPSAETVSAWTGGQFAAALRHDPTCEAYNPHLRQLLHVAYKVAAEMGGRFGDALDEFAEAIAPGVTENIHARHIRALFG